MIFERSAMNARIVVSDNGIGIFRKIRRDLHLTDERHAILELSKGKVTTDPNRHSGQGIYFTSRAFEKFGILSGRLYFGQGKNERSSRDLTDSEGVKWRP